MSTKQPEPAKHPRPDELEGLALPGGRKLRRRVSAHVAECERCGAAVEELRSLDATLKTLVPLHPLVGFSDRVMKRVRLPAPWRVRALEAVRRHQLAAAAALAGAVAAVGVGVTWLTRYPELTPVTVAAFLAERSTSLLWGGVMQVGRFVYGDDVIGRQILGIGVVIVGVIAVALG